MTTSVLHISFSKSGGSGGVAEILSEARLAAGFPTAHSFSIERNLRVAPLSAPLHTVAAVLDDAIFRQPDFNAPISLARDWLEIKPAHELQSWDVLHLHNVNGVLSLGRLAESFAAKRIVWTLHDMNPMTGSCHYSLGCTGYVSDCTDCPAVRIPFRRQVSSSLSRKSRALTKLTNLVVVAPSEWLADRARESTALGSREIHVIPNPIRPEFCAPAAQSAKTQVFTFCIVAQNLADPVKNVRMAVEAFRELRKSHPQISLALVGNGGSSFHSEGITTFGPLPAEEIAEILSQTSSLIVPSLAENSPLVIAEAAAQGTMSIVHDVGGMPDLIRLVQSGIVFSDNKQLLKGMLSVASNNELFSSSSRRALASRALSLFSPASVSQQYDELYSP